MPAYSNSSSQAQSRDVATKKNPALQIPSLDGLRGVSFLLVFLAHAGIEQIPGGFGVTVFFFLSGYLITTLMRVEDARTGRVSLKNFYLRRALRILPPFYITLIGATVVGALDLPSGGPQLQLASVLAQAFHVSNYWIAIHGWGGIAPGTGVYWSLAVEEHFYLLFPAIYLLLRSKVGSERRASLLWGMCAVVLVWRVILVVLLKSNSDRTFLCSDTRFDSILFGCALAMWKNPAVDNESQPSSINVALWRNVLLPAGLALLLITFLVRSPSFRETYRYTLQGLGLTPVFVTAVRWPEWAIYRPLSWKLLRFIGTLSYSLYLIHHATLNFVDRHSSLPSAIRGGLALAVSIAIAWVMYLVVEKPCARLRRKLSASG